MSQQEQWDIQVREIQGTIANLRGQVLDRMEALEQLVRDQDALLQECSVTIEGEWGYETDIALKIEKLQQRTRELLGDA